MDILAYIHNHSIDDTSTVIRSFSHAKQIPMLVQLVERIYIEMVPEAQSNGDYQIDLELPYAVQIISDIQYALSKDRANRRWLHEKVEELHEFMAPKHSPYFDYPTNTESKLTQYMTLMRMVLTN